MRIDFSNVASLERFDRDLLARNQHLERAGSRVKGLSTKTGKVPHGKRPAVRGSGGVHVTWKLREGIPSLRQRSVMREFETCFRAGKERFGLKLMGYTVMSNHLHLIVTADNDLALRRGLQGLGIRLAKTINRIFDRKGRVFGDRFHARALKTAKAVKHAVRYALQNARKHGIWIPWNTWDHFSSARFNMCRGARSYGYFPIVMAGRMEPIFHALNVLDPNDCPGLNRQFAP